MKENAKKDADRAHVKLRKIKEKILILGVSAKI